MNERHFYTYTLEICILIENIAAENEKKMEYKTKEKRHISI
jgi:hypothetical protein